MQYWRLMIISNDPQSPEVETPKTLSEYIFIDFTYCFNQTLGQLSLDVVLFSDHIHFLRPPERQMYKNAVQDYAIHV